MNRLEKLSLLNKVFQGQNPDTTRHQISHALQEEGRGLVAIHDLPAPGERLSDATMVCFHDQGKDHRMSLAGVQEYANRHFISTLFLLPAKEELIRS